MSEERKYMKDYIREAIQANPNLDDSMIKDIVEQQSGKTVTKGYIKKVRSRIELQREPIEITVEGPPELPPEEPELPPEEPEEPPPEEPELPPEEPEDIGERGLGLAEGFEFKQVGNMMAIPFRIVASRTGFRGWQLTRQEINDLSEAWTPVLNYYLPEVLSQYGALIYAGYVTVTIVGSKQLDYNEWRKKQEPQEPEE